MRGDDHLQRAQRHAAHEARADERAEPRGGDRRDDEALPTPLAQEREVAREEGRCRRRRAAREIDHHRGDHAGADEGLPRETEAQQERGAQRALVARESPEEAGDRAAEREPAAAERERLGALRQLEQREAGDQRAEHEVERRISNVRVAEATSGRSAPFRRDRPSTPGAGESAGRPGNGEAHDHVEIGRRDRRARA